MKCRECGNEREGGIHDKIPLCHNCYIKVAEVRNPEEEAV